MAKGIDTDLDCTTMAPLIRAKGYEFVGRYYRMPPPHSKKAPLTKAEATAISRQGMSIAALWEYISGSNDAIDSLTYDTGKDEGQRAYSQALAVPQTPGTPIYFCVDEGYDPADARYAQPIQDYFRGVNDAFKAIGNSAQPAYKIGVYGPGAVCKWLKQQGLVSYTWLAMSTAWPGYNYADWNIQQSRGDGQLAFDNDSDIAKADAGLWQIPVASSPVIANASATGARMLEIAKQHIGEAYANILVPKNNPNWRGPWDCSEFMSWVVYQAAGVIYGCTNDSDSPAVAKAFTGAWKDDSLRLGIRVPVAQAAGIRGGLVLRFPPGPGVMGHIAICDGSGGTVEAMGQQFGVAKGQVAGRRWDTGVLVPNISYDAPALVSVAPPPTVYYVDGIGLDPTVVRRIQTALMNRGFDPGQIDGEYGYNTAVAVAAFQTMSGLVIDGEVGPQTAAALSLAI